MSPPARIVFSTLFAVCLLHCLWKIACLTCILPPSLPPGLFESHKLLFSFAMTMKIQEVESELNQEELDFFIKGNISLEKSTRLRPHDWLPEQGWEDMMKLTTVLPDVFGSLADDVEKNEQRWKEVSLPKVFRLAFSYFLFTLCTVD